MRFLLAVLLALPLIADEVMTNTDVVKLVKAGLSAETIEAKIAASQTNFDTSTDALVALAGEGVPDRVIRAMVNVGRASARPAEKPVEKSRAEARPTLRRYEVAIHSSTYAKCDTGELRIDAKGVKASGCGAKLDFERKWADIKSVCSEYGFRGTVVIDGHRVSTTTPAEAGKIVEQLRARVPVETCPGR